MNWVKCEKLGRKTDGVPEGYIAFRLEFYSPEYNPAKDQVSKNFLTIPYIADEKLRQEAKQSFEKTYKHTVTIIVPQDKAIELEGFFQENRNPVSNFSAFIRKFGGLLHSLGDQPASKTFAIDVVQNKHIEIIEHCYRGVLHRDPEIGPAYIIKTNRVISEYVYFQAYSVPESGRCFSKVIKKTDEMKAAMDEKIAKERAAHLTRA